MGTGHFSERQIALDSIYFRNWKLKQPAVLTCRAPINVAKGKKVAKTHIKLHSLLWPPQNTSSGQVHYYLWLEWHMYNWKIDTCRIIGRLTLVLLEDCRIPQEQGGSVVSWHVCNSPVMLHAWVRRHDTKLKLARCQGPCCWVTRSWIGACRPLQPSQSKSLFLTP